MRLPVPGPRDLLSVLERGADSVEQLLAAVPRMVSLLGEAEELLARVGGLVDRIEETRGAAEEMVERTTPLVDRLAALLDRVEPPLAGLQPTLERLAETTDPREVDALVSLVDLLPRLAHSMQTDIMPVLSSLGTVAPDVRDLLEVTQEVNEMLGAIPGLGRVKRRVEEEQLGDGR